MPARGEATLGRRMMLFGLAIGAIAMLMLSTAAGASAIGEFEPNDSRDTGAGPVEGGKWYEATFETENDVDWYLLYVKTYSQLDISSTMTKSCDYNAYIVLRDLDGEFVRSFYAGDVNETTHMLLTLNRGRYYLEVDYVSSCPKDTYKFRVDPAGSITASRVCGEAIVARDSAVPLLAAVNGDLARNAPLLATKAAAVHEAKGEHRRASKKIVRLKKRLRRTARPGKRRHIRANLRQARREAQSAAAQLEEAKAERAPVWNEKRLLETLAQQHQQRIATADATIAASC